MRSFLTATIVGAYVLSCLPGTVLAAQQTSPTLISIKQVLNDPNPSPAYNQWVTPDPTAVGPTAPPVTYGQPSPTGNTSLAPHPIPGPCYNENQPFVSQGTLVTDSNVVNNIDGAYGRTNMHALWPCWYPQGITDSHSFVLAATIQLTDGIHIVQLGYMRQYAAANSPYVFGYTKYDDAGGSFYNWPGTIPAIQNDQYSFAIWYVRDDGTGHPNWYYQITDLHTGQQQSFYGGDWPCVPGSCRRATWSSSGASGFAWYGFETHDKATVMDELATRPTQPIINTTYRINYGSWSHDCNPNPNYPYWSWYQLVQFTTSCTGDSLYVSTTSPGY